MNIEFRNSENGDQEEHPFRCLINLNKFNILDFECYNDNFELRRSAKIQPSNLSLNPFRKINSTSQEQEIVDLSFCQELNDNEDTDSLLLSNSYLNKLDENNNTDNRNERIRRTKRRLKLKKTKTERKSINSTVFLKEAEELNKRASNGNYN